MSHNIVVVAWDDSSVAYQALSELKNSTDIRLYQAGVFRRELDGRIVPQDGGSNTIGDATIGGSILGSLIGILGGPVGLLVGFSTGALFGSLADIGDAVDDESVIAAIGSRVLPGKTVLIVDLEESDPSWVNKVASASAGHVSRFAYDDVLAEIQSAEFAAEAASAEARRVLKETKRAEKKAEREARWEKRKEKFKSFFK
ncbi:DUF1269 domain-containing protein [Stenotrophomonas sp. NPDC077659]|uniref:DUF1269 domain-containing protein n=1 Tax=Stenotrophomonas sp. NPDC077659 TaxID=3390694 RepID=UPI003D064983